MKISPFISKPLKGSALKRGTLEKGNLLIEATLGFGALLAIALLLLKAAIAVTTLQKWTVVQGLSDARMSLEVASAKRIPFDDFKLVGSTYPAYPTVDTSTVQVGSLPGGRPLSATLRRTRLPMANNLPADGGAGSVNTNPTGMEAWQLQSYLTYRLSGREDVKSRTVLRAR